MSRRLRVHHLITRLELGGAQQNTLYCTRHHDRSRFAVSLGAGPGGILDAEARAIPDAEVTFFPGLRHPVAPAADAAFVLAYARFLRARRIDILHTHSSKAGILGRAAAALARTPVVVHTVHGWGFHDYQRAVVRGLYVWLERRMAPRTDVLIAVSAENRDRGLAEGIGTPSQYRVIRSGIDIAGFGTPTRERSATRAALGLPADAPVVGTVGNFKPQKAPLDFVRAAARIAAAVPAARFVYAGDGELLDRSKALAAELGLADRIVFAGWRDDIPDLLHACDVFALSSLFEGLPRSVLQAMAAGLPVVATAAGGTPEAVADGVTGWVTARGAPDALADRIIGLLRDPAAARAMGEAGRARLGAEFEIRTMLRQIEEVYGDLARIKRLG